jgi:glycosyltransferase involved in cell wall biosynthesis
MRDLSVEEVTGGAQRSQLISMVESDAPACPDHCGQLRIGVDARILAEPHPKGVSRYMSALLLAAAELAPHHKYFLYVSGAPLNEAPFAAQPFRQRVLGSKKRAINPLLWQQLYFPWGAWRDKVNVLLSPYYSGPLFTSAPQVVCMCDISFSLFPQDFPSWVRFKPKLLARPTSHRAARVMTISEFSRREIIRVYKLAPEKVVTIPAGSESRLWPRPGVGAKRSQVCLDTPFFLFVGNLLPRRQVGLVVQALARLPHEYHLVVVGESDPSRYAALMATARHCNVAERVHCIGHVSDEELDELYYRAVALVSPSVYEGFGLPVLEAMNRGLPVIAWEIPVMSEVGAGATILLPVGDVEGLAVAMQRVSADASLRTMLCQAGKEQARKFSWERSAAALLAVLHDVVEERSPLLAVQKEEIDLKQ